MNEDIIKEPCADSVLAEVWRIKEQIAAEHGCDVRRIAAAAIEAQKRHPERVVDLSARKAKQAHGERRLTRPESKHEP